MNITRLRPKLINYITGKEYQKDDYLKYPELQEYFRPIIIDYLNYKEKQFELCGDPFEKGSIQNIKKLEDIKELVHFEQFIFDFITITEKRIQKIEDELNIF